MQALFRGSRDVKGCLSISRCSQHATVDQLKIVILSPTNIHDVMINTVTINVIEFIFSMLCRNIECR